MANQADPARFVFAAVVSALLLLVGVLDALSAFRGNLLLAVVGVVLAVAAGVWLIVSVRGYRRERARR